MKSVLSVTILSGATQSNAIDIPDDYGVVGVHMPAAFTGTSLTIQVAPTLTGTYGAAQSSNTATTAHSIAVTAGQYAPITENIAIVAGWRFLKLTSNGAEAADRVIKLAIRPL